MKNEGVFIQIQDIITCIYYVTFHKLKVIFPHNEMTVKNSDKSPPNVVIPENVDISFIICGV